MCVIEIYTWHTLDLAITFIIIIVILIYTVMEVGEVIHQE